MADRKKTGSNNGSKSGLNLINGSGRPSRGTTGINATNDLKKLSDSSRVMATPIAFGKPSSTGTGRQTSSSAINWQSLLTKSTKGGISKAFSGGLIGFGVSALFSGFSGWFGGGEQTEEPLKEFSLPDSQNATIYQTSGRLSTTAAETSNQLRPAGSYRGQQASADQASVVKAVKQALLTSSTLNDIIGDL